MTSIKLLGFISQSPKSSGMGNGEVKGKFTQRIANYLPTGLKGVYLDGIEFTATDLTNLTNLKSVWIPTDNGGTPTLSTPTNRIFTIPTQVGASTTTRVKLPTGAGFNNSAFGGS